MAEAIKEGEGAEGAEAAAALAAAEAAKTALAAVDINATPTTVEEAAAIIAELKKVVGKEPDWVKGRIAKATAQMHEAERQSQAKDGIIEQQKQQIADLAAAGKTVIRPSEEEIDARANVKAADRLYAESCNKVIEAGSAAHKDFGSDVEKLHGLSPVFAKAPNGASIPVMPRPFVESLLELDAAHEVMHALAQPANLDEASRIMALPPAKQAIALAKFAVALKPEKEVSKTPPPNTVLVDGKGAGKGGVDLYDKSTKKEDWFAARNKEIAEKRARH